VSRSIKETASDHWEKEQVGDLVEEIRGSSEEKTKPN